MGFLGHTFFMEWFMDCFPENTKSEEEKKVLKKMSVCKTLLSALKNFSKGNARLDVETISNV